MEHAVHLGSEKFVKGVSPTAGNAILRKVRRAFKNAKQGEMVDIDQLDVECENIMEADGDDGKYGEDGEDDDEFDTGDACGKALALVKQVC